MALHQWLMQQQQQRRTTQPVHQYNIQMKADASRCFLGLIWDNPFLQDPTADSQVCAPHACKLRSKACKVQAAQVLEPFAHPMLQQPRAVLNNGRTAWSEHQARYAMHKQTQCTTSVAPAALKTLHLCQAELTYRLSRQRVPWRYYGYGRVNRS